MIEVEVWIEKKKGKEDERDTVLNCHEQFNSKETFYLLLDWNWTMDMKIEEAERYWN